MTESISEREAYENSYHLFVTTVLAALADESAGTVQGYGGYNVGGELVLDVRNALYLCESPASTLTSVQKTGITGLVEAMATLPVEVASFTESAQQSLANLSHPSWEPIRGMARQLLKTLESATKANEAYFANGGST